jgi:DNA topoisomerase-1
LIFGEIGTPLTLEPEPEEVAGFFAALLETEHAADKTFRANFFRDWLKLLKDHPPAEGIKVTDFNKCDFRPMFEYFELQKEKKKQLTAAEKKQAKAEREAIEKPYLFATIDGRKEKVGNFRVEPPGLFRGRGEHPKKGTFKYRLNPEDIVVNIAESAPVPVPNIPGQWKEVVHDNTVTWLAHWKENVNGNSKYVFLSAGSTWKGQSDRQKFEKAKKLQVSWRVQRYCLVWFSELTRFCRLPPS